MLLVFIWIASTKWVPTTEAFIKSEKYCISLIKYAPHEGLCWFFFLYHVPVLGGYFATSFCSDFWKTYTHSVVIRVNMVRSVCAFKVIFLVKLPDKYISKVFSQRLILTHCSLETSKRVIGKQCKPKSDATECGIWSVSPLFANSSTIFL